MKPKIKVCCENCAYRQKEPIDNGYVCVNSDSYKCADWVEDDYSCRHWQEKLQNQK